MHEKKGDWKHVDKSNKTFLTPLITLNPKCEPINFKLTFKQTDDDKQSANYFKRCITMHVSENIPPIKVQLPVSYDGPATDQNKEVNYTPEDLFLGALGGCFFNVFSVIAKNSKLAYESIDIMANGDMDETMMSQVDLTVTLTVPTGTNEKLALKTLRMADQHCPLANSVKSKIVTHFTISYT